MSEASEKVKRPNGLLWYAGSGLFAYLACYLPFEVTMRWLLVNELLPPDTISWLGVLYAPVALPLDLLGFGEVVNDAINSLAALLP